MNIRSKLPSAQFTLIVGSLALSAGVVFAAERFTNPPTPAHINTPLQNEVTNPDWEESLQAIQAQSDTVSFVEPDQDAVSKLLAAAQGPNVTDTVGKTLFINLSSAKSQGLGDDIPTQEQIIAAAASQVSALNPASLHKLTDLTIIADSPVALKTYGNTVIQVFSNHPDTSVKDTFVAIGNAVDNGDKKALQKLPLIQKGYEALTNDLLTVPVPQKLAPLHLLIVNDFVRVTGSYTDMTVMLDDPLRGLAGLQNYQAYLNESGRVFTQIAQNLNKEGILFSKDEPGSAWSAFLTSQ